MGQGALATRFIVKNKNAGYEKKAVVIVAAPSLSFLRNSDSVRDRARRSLANEVFSLGFYY